MPWTQLSIRCTQKELEQIEAVLEQLGSASITCRDAEDDAILEPAPGETPMWQEIIVTGLFEQRDNNQLIADFLAIHPLPENRLQAENLEDQNWERSWMDQFQPMSFGKRLWVCPHHDSSMKSDSVVLKLDPGMAFGTGTHPTTSLCLKWLDAHLQNSDAMLDYGCGSGILAIAACLLGARAATGCDIDEQALIATRENAKMNQVDQKITVCYPEQLPETKYDLVMANILSGPLVMLAPILTSHVKTGGDLVLSGILREQSQDVREAYAQHFELSDTQYEDDWVLIHGVKR